MGMKLQYITPLLAAGAAAVAIAAAPTDVQHHPAGDMPDLTVQDLALALGLAT